MDQNEIEIVIGGDFVPAGSEMGAFEQGNALELVGNELLSIIHGADFCVFNLEVPLTDKAAPIAKCGPNLIAPTSTINGLIAINPGLFALANNHILDQGAQGLESTMSTLNSAGVKYFGAGKNIEEAREPFVFEKNGIKIGFYACAEHEFTIATEKRSGANPFDPLESLDHIANLKENCDYVVVLYHGGKEHYRYPSPMLQRTCRKIADKGADLVVCQHSHCIGCKEDWNGSTIVYGQGNFLFDDGENEFWQTSLLLEVSFGKTGVKVEYRPIRKQGPAIRLAHGADAEEILLAFDMRSKQIVQPHFVEKEYTHFAGTMLNSYLNAFIPGSKSIVYRVVNRLFCRKLASRIIGKRQILSQINYIDCEAHRELFLTALRERMKW